MLDPNSPINVELFKATIEAGRNALKAGMIINGAAAISILTFIGSVASHPEAQYIINSLACPLAMFTLGITLCASAAGLTFLGQRLFQKSNTDFKAHRLNRLTMILVGSSYVTFIAGCATAYNAFINWP